METAIVGIVGAFIGILLTNALRLIVDWRNRLERVRDIQTALRAEIRSQRGWLESFQNGELNEQVLTRLGDESYRPFIVREVASFVFSAIVHDIHLLPGDVIDPIVLYQRQYQTLLALGDDLRSEQFLALSNERRRDVYRDYLLMGIYAVELADRAVEAINVSLEKNLGR
jgi:hypothetical protein